MSRSETASLLPEELRYQLFLLPLKPESCLLTPRVKKIFTLSFLGSVIRLLYLTKILYLKHKIVLT